MYNNSVFDLFFDLPHPAASSASEQAKVVCPHPSSIGLSEVVTSELFEPSNVARVALFAFPEYEDYEDNGNGTDVEINRKKLREKLFGVGLNRFDVYYDSFAASYHTFALQLRNGLRIHGHVRRYLPSHKNAHTRYDVGRRGIRALVLLTRAPGGERFYTSVLRTMEAIMSLSTTNGRRRPEQAFLHALEDKQSELNFEFQNIQDSSSIFDSAPSIKSNGASSNWNSGLLSTQHEYINGLVIDGTEFGENSPLQSLDSLRFVLPKSLQPGYTGEYSCDYIDTPLLPLFRCLGVSHTLRLLSALLCECRVIFISSSASRLNHCVRGAAALLGQGLLVWQHLMGEFQCFNLLRPSAFHNPNRIETNYYIICVLVPVLPPHLIRFLSTPGPYLIGLLDVYSHGIELVPGLGEVLCINLDDNTMETYGMADPGTAIPDLLIQLKGSKADKNSACCDALSQDINEVLKSDKLFWTTHKATPGTTPSTSVSETEKMPNYNKQILSLFGSDEDVDANDDRAVVYGKIIRAENVAIFHKLEHEEFITANPSDVDEVDAAETFMPASRLRKVMEDTVDTDSCENEPGEKDIRIALTIFYLFIIGDMGMFLSEDYDGTLYCDRKKYLMCRLAVGGKESSPLFLVLKKLARTSMFKQFIKNRIYEIEQPISVKKQCISQHRSLFSTCERFIRLNKLDWTMSNIRSVIQRISQYSIRHKNVTWCEEVREMTLHLMSYQDFNADTLKFLAELIDHGCEVNGALCQIMGVAWIKLQDARASMWKHPLISLHLLRNLLLHGPLTAITEITDGINHIRALKNYTSNRSPDGGRSVRVTASEVYKLIVDRVSLFNQRKQLACKRLRLGAVDMKDRKWLDYMVRRLPVPVDFKTIVSTNSRNYNYSSLTCPTA